MKAVAGRVEQSRIRVVAACALLEKKRQGYCCAQIGKGGEIGFEIFPDTVGHRRTSAAVAHLRSATAYHWRRKPNVPVFVTRKKEEEEKGEAEMYFGHFELKNGGKLSAAVYLARKDQIERIKKKIMP